MYSFWDYLPGAIVFGILGLGFLGAFGIQVIVSIAAVFAGIFGVARPSNDGYLTIKASPYDEDEDR